MKGERGEIDEDEDWERMVAVSGPDTHTSFHHVRFNLDKPERCWANGYYNDGTAHGCFNIATEKLGLCKDHYKEIVRG